uniref:Uncharacterized protein n=1 Tax=Rhizophora mucronata TaxID=61149 RepID=A0A2P2MHW3_RHIMU
MQDNQTPTRNLHNWETPRDSYRSVHPMQQRTRALRIVLLLSASKWFVF